MQATKARPLDMMWSHEGVSKPFGVGVANASAPVSFEARPWRVNDNSFYLPWPGHRLFNRSVAYTMQQLGSWASDVCFGICQSALQKLGGAEGLSTTYGASPLMTLLSVALKGRKFGSDG